MMSALFTKHYLAVLLIISMLAAVAAAREGGGLRADPDTTCSDAFRKSPSKNTCLSTNDHFTRPCEYCTEKDGEIYCYNADEAKWAKLFGANCEIPSSKVE